MALHAKRLAWTACASLACAIASCQGQTLQAYPDELAGVGIVVQSSGQGHTITKIVADGPAAVAGLQVGDRIVSVDGRSTVGQPLAEVIESLRGKAGTSVEVRTTGPRGELTTTLHRRLLARASGGTYRAN